MSSKCEVQWCRLFENENIWSNAVHHPDHDTELRDGMVFVHLLHLICLDENISNNDFCLSDHGNHFHNEMIFALLLHHQSPLIDVSQDESISNNDYCHCDYDGPFRIDTQFSNHLFLHHKIIFLGSWKMRQLVDLLWHHSKEYQNKFLKKNQ